jgi:hypothetical protein
MRPRDCRVLEIDVRAQLPRGPTTLRTCAALFPSPAGGIPCQRPILSLQLLLEEPREFLALLFGE